MRGYDFREGQGFNDKNRMLFHRRVGIFRLIPLLSRYGGGEPDSMTRMEGSDA